MNPLKYIMCALLAVLTTACTKSTETLVREAAGHCPVTIEGVGFVRNISLEGDTLVYDCTVTNRDVDIEALAGNTESVKRVMLPEILRLFDGNPELLEAIRADRLVLSVRYMGQNSGKPLVVDFAPEELASGRGADAPYNPERRLADEIAISKAALPAQLAEGIDVVDIDTLDGMVTFFCTVKEEIAGDDAISNLRSNAREMHTEMLGALRGATGDGDVNTLVEIATGAGYGIAYRYEGNVTGDTLSLNFSLDSLKK